MSPSKDTTRRLAKTAGQSTASGALEHLERRAGSFEQNYKPTEEEMERFRAVATRKFILELKLNIPNIVEILTKEIDG